MDRRALVILLTLAACQAPAAKDADDPMDDGKGDGPSVTDFACKVGAGQAAKVVDFSTRGLKDANIAALNDPFAQVIIRDGTGCPTTYQDMMAKLIKGRGDSDCLPDEALMYFLAVSARAEITQEAAPMRTVLQPKCGANVNGSSGALFISSPTRVKPGDKMPTDVEVIAQDPTTGIYNFYAVEPLDSTNPASRPVIKFMGDQWDLMTKTPPAKGDTLRCARCHVGGHLVMKELAEPWPNWDAPGTQQIGDETAAALGTNKFEFEVLQDLEGDIRGAQSSWNELRLAKLAGLITTAPTDAKRLAATKLLLHPLFCTEQVEMSAAGALADHALTTASTPADLQSPWVPPGMDWEFFVEYRVPTQEIFGDYEGIGSSDSEAPIYLDAIRAIGQRVVGDDGKQVLYQGQGVIDTPMPFMYATKGSADGDYLNMLEGQSDYDILDRDIEIALDTVDMTRADFSDRRCALLDSMPALGPEDLHDPASSRAKIVAALSSKASRTADEQSFLDALNMSHADLMARYASYLTTCRARAASDPVGYWHDMLQIVAQRRDAARKLPIIQHGEELPTTTVAVDPSVRLDPATCSIAH